MEEQNKDKIIDEEELTLSEWLDSMQEIPEEDERLIFTDYMFPSDKIREEFLDNIANYNIDVIMHIIEKFLMPSGSLGVDSYNYIFLKEASQTKLEGISHTFLLKHTYYRRLGGKYLDFRFVT